MSFSNPNILSQLYHGLSNIGLTPPASPLGRAVPFNRMAHALGNSTTCFDGMSVDDTPKSSPTMDPITPGLSSCVGLPLSALNMTAHPLNMCSMSIPINLLFDDRDADSLSRSKGGEQPVLEHLLSADGARTLSLGKHRVVRTILQVC